MAQELKVNIGVKTTGADEAVVSLKSIVDQIDAVDKALASVATDSKAYTELSAKSKALKKDLEGVAEAINKQDAEPIKAVSKATGSWKDAVGDLTSKIPGLSAAQKVLNLVMEANPVGLLVAAFGALIGILSQNKEVMDKISFAFAGFTKIVRVISDDIVEFGKKFVGALSNPKQAIIDLGTFIENNLINRVKGLGAIVQALASRDFSKLKTALIEVGTGFDANQQAAIGNYASKLVEVGKEGFNAAEKLDQLVESQGALLPVIARTTAEIEKQRTILANRTKTDDERIAAADKIIKLETLNAQRRAKIAQDEYNAELLKAKGVKQSGEEIAALRAKEAAAIDAVSGVEQATRRAQNEKDVLKQSIIDDAALKEKAELEAAQKRDETNKKNIEKEQANQAKLTEILVQSEAGRQLALAHIKIAEAITPEQKLQAQKDLDALLLQQTIDAEQAKADAKKLIITTQIAEQGVATQDQAAALIKIESDTATEITRIKAEAAQKERDQSEETQKKLQKDREAAATGVLTAAAQGLSAIQSLTDGIFAAQRAKVLKGSKEDIEIQKKQFKASKALQLVNAGIQTAQAVIAAYSSGAAVPIAGVALGPIMAAIAAAAGAVQIGFIASKQFNPEGGGSTSGPPTPGGAGAGAAIESASASVSAASGRAFNPSSVINGARTGPLASAPVKVYVTETDITETQQRVSVIQQKATYP